MRTCIACRTRRPQAALLRVVRTPNGAIHIDRARKRGAGRGAYICPDECCVRLAERRQSLCRALRCQVPADLYDDLCAEAAGRGT